jgi:hypothetical protein
LGSPAIVGGAGTQMTQTLLNKSIILSFGPFDLINVFFRDNKMGNRYQQ